MEKEEQVSNKLPKLEKFRLEIANKHVNYLINLFKKYQIKNVSHLGDKKLLYNILYCLKIIGEALNVNSITNTVQITPAINNYGLELNFLRDRLIHSFCLLNRQDNIFHLKYNKFLEALANLKKALFSLKNLINDLLQDKNNSHEDNSKPFKHVKATLINTPQKDSTENKLNILKEEISHFKSLAAQADWPNLEKDLETYYALLNSFEIITSSIKKFSDHKIILNQLKNLFNEPQDKQRIDDLLKSRIDIFHNFKSGVGLEIIKFLAEKINIIEPCINNLSAEDFQQVQTVTLNVQQLSLGETSYPQPQEQPVLDMQYQQYLIQQQQQQLYYQQYLQYYQLQPYQYQWQPMQPQGYTPYTPNYYSQAVYQPLTNQSQPMQQQDYPQQTSVEPVAYNPNAFFYHTPASNNPSPHHITPTQTSDDDEKKAEKNENSPKK